MNARLTATLLASVCLIACNTGTKWASDYERESKAATDSRKARVKSSLASATLQSQGTLVRGDKRETIDLLKDRKKVKDGDVIELNEGRYADLGMIVAKNVRFVGKGRRKTFLSNEGSNTPILMDGLQLWDLTLVNSTFQDLGSTGLWLVGSELVGNTQVIANAPEGQVMIHSVLSDGMLSEVPVRALFSRHSGGYNLDEPVGYYYWPNYLPWPLEQVTKAVLADNGTGDGFTLGRASQAELGKPELWKDIEFAISAHHPASNRMSHFDKARLRKQVAVAAQYANAHGLAAPVDPAKADKLIQYGDAAAAKGHLFAALLAYRHASIAAGYSRDAEIRAKAEPIARKVQGDGGCEVIDLGKTKPEDNVVHTVRDGLHVKAVLLAMKAKSCALMIKNLGGTNTSMGQGTVIAREAIWEPSAEAQAQARAAHMARAAAERAAARAQQASITAATEKMASTAKIAAESRFRIEDAGGGQKYMVWGAGNGTGSASASTQSQVNYYKDAANRLNGQANQVNPNDPGAKKIGENQTIAVNRTFDSTYAADGVLILGGAKQVIQFDRLSSQRVQNCTDKRTGGGNFSNFSCSGSTTTGFNGNYGWDIVTPKALKALDPKMLKPRRDQALAQIKSKDPMTRLNGYILLNGVASMDNPDKEIAALLESELGVKSDARFLASSAIAF